MILFAPFAPLQSPSHIEASNTDVERVVESNTAFAIDLLKELDSKEDNVFFSPYSISTVLAVLYAGAREETASQMAETLHLTLQGEDLHAAFADIHARLNAIQQKKNIELHTANSLWMQERYPFLREHVDLAEGYYQAEVFPVDFRKNPEAVRVMINGWVEKETNNKIIDMIPKRTPPILNPFTTFVVTNAIYFKGVWETQFEENATRGMVFYPHAGESVETPMMRQTNSFRYADNDVVQVIELPYTEHALSMFVVLPRDIDSLNSIERNLKPQHIDEWSGRLSIELVEVYLPRFEMTTSYDLKDVLKRMGMKNAFDRRLADFSGIDGIPNWLFIEFFLHKAFINVNEEGTEAAAATASGCFPPGTQVLTEHGLRPIETVVAGTRVYACDLETGAWSLTNVVEQQYFLYEGDMVTIRFGNDAIQATGNQPFFVTRGEGLFSRPVPQDIAVDELSVREPGRWVEARDLEVGDLLKRKGGEDVKITGLSNRRELGRVYCLDVERFHNCAVHRLGILTHNEGKSGEGPEPVIFLADHPFLFLIRDNETDSIMFMGRIVRPY
jgi:serpin B